MPPADPQWGKKNNEGPPDLDEILRKLQQKIAGLLGFGGRRGDSAPPPGGGAVGAAVGGGVVFIVLLLVAVWLGSRFFIRDEGRRGIVVRLSQLLEITQPGPRSHLPYAV